MSNYTKSTNFATKDNLTPGDPLKVVRGTEIDTEYNNIATAVATKTDNASAAITGGAIDATTVGATTPATGSFTTLAASGTTTLAGALVGAVTQAAFNTTTTTLNLGGAATAVNLGAATGTATVNNTTLAAKAITASTTLAVTGTSTLTGAVTATAGVSGPITSSNVSITGGSITGITDLAVADGGTGASTAATALNNLLPSQTSNANKYLQTDGTNATWDAVTLSTADITGTLGVANGGTGVTSSTGTVAVVLSNSPTLVTPALGTPSAAVLTNATGLPISTGVSGLGTGVATLLATPSSANLASAITDETGSGSLVFATSPTLVTPILGTPTSATLTNATGLPIATGVSGLGTGVATFLATPSSANLAAALTDETGTGSAVFATSPTLVTPLLGTPTSGVATNLTGLPLTTGVTGTLPTANGGTNLGGATPFTSGGVVFASSSSALATGSALVFDGTNLGVGVTPSAWRSTDVALQIRRSCLWDDNSNVLFLGQNVFENSSGNYVYIGSDFATLYAQLNGKHEWNTAASGTAGNTISFTQAMTLDASGNLGIGTTSPNNTLHLKSETDANIKFEDTTSGTAGFVGPSANNQSDTTATRLGIRGEAGVAFSVGSATKMVLDSSGNVGIGTTSPPVGLSVQGTTADAVTLQLKQNASGGRDYRITSRSDGSLRFNDDTAALERMRLDSSGNFLVGTTTPTNSPFSSTSKFVVSGDFTGGFGQSITDTNTNTAVDHYLISFNLGTASGNQKGYIQFVGSSGLVLYSTTSDQRLKTDLGVVTDTSVIDNLLIHDYTWKESGIAGRGVFAQEAYEVMPNAIGKGKDAEDGSINTPWGVDYSKFVPDLIVHAQQLKKQVQEQQTLIQSLKARLDAANL